MVPVWERQRASRLLMTCVFLKPIALGCARLRCVFCRGFIPAACVHLFGKMLKQSFRVVSASGRLNETAVISVFESGQGLVACVCLDNWGDAFGTSLIPT